MTEIVNVSRRRFLQAAGAGTASLILGFRLLDGGAERALAATDAAGAEVVFNPNAWLEITGAGQVIISVPWSELGQGCLTAVAMLLAEELEADWEAIDVRKAHNDPRFGEMTTGGSRSVRLSWDPVRKAGAAARTMLVAAAAAAWGVPADACRASSSRIEHPASGRTVGFGEVAAAAAALDVPTDVPLKPRDAYTLIGHSPARVDAPAKITGEAKFGIDQRLPGMLFAAVARCPVFGGQVRAHDDGAARAVAGVKDVFVIDAGVAVVADSTWAAVRGRDALDVTWDPGPHAGLDSAAISERLAATAPDAAVQMRDDGDIAAALATAAKRLDAVYELPFLSHSPMEPMNCTVQLSGDRCEIWVPTQSVSWSQQVAAQVAGLPLQNVRVQPTYAGGGFGRRLMVDYVAEAVAIAKQAGRPIQLVWSREDDMRHDYYRPASRHQLQAGLDAQGRLTAWSHHLAAPSIMGQLEPDRYRSGKDDGAVDGAANLPYGIDNVRVTYAMTNTAVPVGWLRSVYNTQNALANECFLDEIATAAGRDPVALRLDLLPDDSRLRGTLTRAAEIWGWPRELPAGHGQGVACHASFGSHVTEMAEVSTDGTGRVKVHRVLCVVDCGPVVHPDGLRAQLEGVVAFALSGLLYEAVTIKDGRVEQGNFDDYPVLRLDEMPRVDVVTIDSQDSIGGIGEPGYPPLGPAVLNALHAATGRRVRRLPVYGQA